MRLSQYLTEARVLAGVETPSQETLFTHLLENILPSLPGVDIREINKQLVAREVKCSTAIGEGLSIPHLIIKELPEIVLGVAVLKNGMDFDAPDRQPVRVIFLLLSPQDRATEHIKLLARITRLFKNQSLYQKMIEAQSPREVFRLILDEDSKHLF